MIKLDEKTVGVWFLNTTETQDWLCTIREIEPDAKYEIVYRFRYYADNGSRDPFDGSDQKNWYKGAGKMTRHYAISSMRFMMEQLKAAGAVGDPYELLMENGDVEAFFREFQKAPFVFAKQISKEEAENLDIEDNDELRRDQGKEVGTAS